MGDNNTLIANPLIPAAVSAWDTMVIGGQTTPGVVTVEDCPRKFKVDKKNPAGAQGWVNTYQGWDAGENIRITLRFWKAEQIDDFYDRIWPIVYVDATKAPPSAGIEVEYPSLAANQIYTLFPVSVGDLKKVDPTGIWAVRLEFVEWRPAGAKNLTSTPSGAAKSGTDAQEKQDPDPENHAGQKQRIAGKAKMANLTGVDPAQTPKFNGG